MKEKYLNPHTDFGFKRLFGSEFNKERIFTRLFEQAEIAKFSQQELLQYEDSVNAYRDIINAINTAIKDGYAEGKAKGMEERRKEGMEEGIRLRNLEIAKNMIKKGLAIADISELTGLPIEDIERFL